jgi:hypothetical protein
MGMGYNFSLWSLVRPVYWNLDAIGAIVIAFLALLLAVPATLIGWVVQALAVVLWRLLQNATPHSGGTS